MQKSALHLHTRHSDGESSIQEIWAAAKSQGFECIGICDHHTMAGVDEANSLGIPNLAGVECTCILNGDGIHVVGYFPNYANHNPAPRMAAILTAGKQNSVARVEAVVAKLKAKLEELKATGLNAVPLRLDHISIDTILANKSPDDIVTRDVAPLIIDSGVLSHFPRSEKGPEWDAFMFYKNQKLGVEYSDFNFPSAEEVVNAIKLNGGIAVLAHPGRIAGVDMKSFIKNPTETRKLLTETIKGIGFDALEVKHKSHYQKGEPLGSDTSYTSMLKEVATELKLLQGINSVDLHTRAELADMPALASSTDIFPYKGEAHHEGL